MKTIAFRLIGCAGLLLVSLAVQEPLRCAASQVVLAAAGGFSHSLALLGNAPPTIFARVPLANPAWTSSGFSFSLPSQNGRVYSMECSDSLSDNNWTVVSLAAGNGGTLTLTDSTAPNAARFYRVRQW